MNKEELLEQLKQISELMSKDVDDLTGQKVALEVQISELELKLSDDKNYPIFNHFINRTSLYDYKKKIEDLNLEQERNEANILEDKTKLNKLDLDIESRNELISSSEQILDELGRKLRGLGESPDKQLEKELSDKITEEREKLKHSFLTILLIWFFCL